MKIPGLIIIIWLFPAVLNGSRAQTPGPQWRSYDVWLNDFNLMSIGLVLLLVMAILLIRRLRRRVPKAPTSRDL